MLQNQSENRTKVAEVMASCKPRQNGVILPKPYTNVIRVLKRSTTHIRHRNCLVVGSVRT
jgi:hypothetical protein